MASDLDLVLEREVACSVEHLWRGYTDPDLLKKWFTPAPWKTIDAEIDPRPGGIFRTVMQGPDGETNAGTGCVLVAEPHRRFVWTSALGPGFRPLEASDEDFFFTAVLEFSPTRAGALYRATAVHRTPAEARTHAEMGFHEGWGAALDQLVVLFDS